MKYVCMKPEWADNEPCPIDTGEYEPCASCPNGPGRWRGTVTLD